MIQHLQALFIRGFNTIIPPRCVLTGVVVDRQGMIAPHIWRELDFIIDPLCKCCGFPFEIHSDKETLCGQCLNKKPIYKSARAALKYNDTSRDLVLRFKHADQTHLTRSFIPLLRNAGKDMLDEADYLIPVPLHHWRMFRRRYNQSALIAQTVSKDSGVPVMLDALFRIRATPPQSRLGARERFRNVKSAFIANPRRLAALKDKTVILIDDVYTTGATVQECVKVLLKAGVKDVHVLTLARTFNH